MKGNEDETESPQTTVRDDAKTFSVKTRNTLMWATPLAGARAKASTRGAAERPRPPRSMYLGTYTSQSITIRRILLSSVKAMASWCCLNVPAKKKKKFSCHVRLTVEK